MAASTASICLRKESLSVHSQSNLQDSSRFNQYLLRLVQGLRGIVPFNRLETPTEKPGKARMFITELSWPVCVAVLSSSMQTSQSRRERSTPTSFTSLLSFRQLPRLQEHRVEHGFGEDPGEGVLLGGMVATEEDDTGRRYVPGAVGKLG